MPQKGLNQGKNRSSNRSRPPKPRVKSLPRYVVLKFDPNHDCWRWAVKRDFPTQERNKKGKIIYVQFARWCVPETVGRAEELAGEIEADFNRERARAKQISTDPSLSELIERVLAAKKKSISRRTSTFYSELFTVSIEATAFGKTNVSEIKTLGIQNFYDGLDISPDRIKKLNVLISMAFNQAIIWELATKNPTKGVILPKITKTETAAFNAKTAKHLRAVCLKHDHLLKFAFDLETGLRPQEVLALPWSNIDLKRRKAKVTQAIAEGENGIVVGDPKTKESYRSVRFSEEMADALEAHRRRQKERIQALKDLIEKPLLLKHMKRMGVNYKRRQSQRNVARETLANIEKYGLVFPATNGKPQAIGNANTRDFQEALKLAKIKKGDYSFESLRHTNLSILAEKITPKRLQKHAGHSHFSTTMKYYVHIDEDQDELPDKLAGVLY